MKANKQAVVIGSGFGGLAVAIRLMAQGIQTTIVEKSDVAGGKAQVIREQGFSFDTGPTVVTAPECIEELFTLAGKNMADYVELIDVQPFYRLFWEDGSTFNYTNNETKLLQEISKFSADDVAGYKRFCAYAEDVYRAGYEELCHVPFLRFSDMIKAAPDLIRLQAYRSVYSKVSSYIKNEKLRQAFSFNSLLIGGHPYRASSIYTLIHPLEKRSGVKFPRGGTHALVQALLRLFADMGGNIIYSRSVDEVVCDNGIVRAVRLTDGEMIACDLVVSNADVMHTYRTLLRHAPGAAKKSRQLANKRFSMSLFLVYFGIKGDYANLAHHNVMFGQRYRGLLDDIFDKKVIADDFSIYLHMPSKSDASLAPEGHSACYALVPVPNLVDSKVDWEQFQDTYGERILSYLENHYMPGLRERIVVKKFCTPKHFAEQQNAYQGAVFSLEPTLTQSAWFRVHNRDDQIKGMYFVGAGTHPGAGIPGVIGSAKATSGVIAKDLTEATRWQ